jgi:hypothetical protein
VATSQIFGGVSYLESFAQGQSWPMARGYLGFPLRIDDELSWCPTVRLDYQRLGNDGVEASTSSAALGLSVGGRVRTGTSSALVPFVGIGFQHTRVDVGFLGETASASDGAAYVSGGLGVRMSSLLSASAEFIRSLDRGASAVLDIGVQLRIF